jgi:uncharacterized membrane protein
MAVPAKLAPYLSQKDLDAISFAVSEAESRTAGEIRVHIAHGLLPFEKPRARAIREFFRLGMDKTRDRTGVLLFLVLKKHRFEIVADQGIHSRVADGTWEQIARSVEKSIREDGLARGICQGVQQIGDVLAQHVPRQADDQDELSNEVTFSESSSEKSSDPDPSQKS